MRLSLFVANGFRKFRNASSILALASCILSLLFVILYAVNVNSSGYFQGVKAPLVVPFAIIVMVLDLLAIGRVYIRLGGVGGKLLDVCAYVAKALVPMFLFLAALTLLQTRIEGIGYIFFSNVDVAKEVATPENVASATLSIVAVSTGILAALISIVSAFFLPRVSEEDQVVVEE